MDIELRKKVYIMIGGAKEEAVVYMAFLCSKPELFVECFECGSLRIGIRHIEKGGYASSSCSPTLCIEICLLRKSWLTKMHMIINQTW